MKLILAPALDKSRRLGEQASEARGSKDRDIGVRAKHGEHQTSRGLSHCNAMGDQPRQLDCEIPEVQIRKRTESFITTPCTGKPPLNKPR